MKIGLIVPDAAGHALPGASLGKILQEKIPNTTVTLISLRPAEKYAQKTGIQFLSFGTPEESAEFHKELQKAANLKGKEAFHHIVVAWSQQTAILFRDLPPLLKREEFDGLLIDETIASAMSVAELMDIPFGSISNALPMFQDPWLPPFFTTWQPPTGLLGEWGIRLVWGFYKRWIVGRLIKELIEWRQAQKLPALTDEAYKKQGVFRLAQLPSCLDFPRKQMIPHFFHTRPWHTPERDGPGNEAYDHFPWDQLETAADSSCSARPLIYASMGTIQNQIKEIYYHLAEACHGLDRPVQLVLALGRKGAILGDMQKIAQFQSDKCRILVVDFAPQIALLSKASVLVTHAGQNTALEGVMAGLPILAIPISSEQPGVAARLVYAGAAKLVSPPSKATPATLQSALQELLRDPNYRLASQRLQASIQDPKQTPTFDQVAELIRVGFGNKKKSLDRTGPKALKILGQSILDKVQKRKLHQNTNGRVYWMAAVGGAALLAAAWHGKAFKKLLE